MDIGISACHRLGFVEPVPEAGDVVVRAADDCPTDYLLSAAPGPPQIRCTAYLSAFECAKRWAAQHHVDVWFAEQTFVLLSRHRHDDLARDMHETT